MFLPNVTIPENIECSNDFKEVIEDAEFILHVTPSKFTRSTFKQYKQYVDNKYRFISNSKMILLFL